MRTPSLIAAAVLSCGFAFAGHSENVVYTDGNLAGINPQTSAVLDLSQDKAMKLRVGRTDVSVPYASITGTNAPAAEPAAAKSGKKGAKPVQAVTVQFNSAQGEARTMTLQLSKPAASHVLATIHKHTPATTQIASVQPPASLQPARSDKTATLGASAPSDSSSASAATPPAAASDTKKKSKDKVAKKNKKDKKSKEEEEKQEASNKPKKAWNCLPDLPANCAKEDWWGDSTWKTNRNSAKWEQPSATAAAQ